jgi:outer membrane protein assembly factor BamD (BamD/ComL family)
MREVIIKLKRAQEKIQEAKEELESAYHRMKLTDGAIRHEAVMSLIYENNDSELKALGKIIRWYEEQIQPSKTL